MSEQHTDQAKNAFHPVLAAAQRQFDAFTQAQSELTRKCWMDRGRSEASLASEFTSKLAATHSIPDAMTVWQDWSRQRPERMVEDGKHLAADVQEIMKNAARLLPNGGAQTNGPSGLAS